ncbi:DUF6443 domain-containing protein [Pararcticibacter amylolyticus]|uniref:RHS repeat-associated core domain-containing protein n=1 Tax=Pararcticibacter amylolyticus TaxID=2173175 RepID=A0A2U2PJM3_9SPHI|nr:DUF6443 domain-containing protein [Pararcticibacter amylolyticus]PWG81603.1 hypothetical protein DDR33_07165 [Pararcticibacter amylolyticus]
MGKQLVNKRRDSFALKLLLAFTGLWLASFPVRAQNGTDMWDAIDAGGGNSCYGMQFYDTRVNDPSYGYYNNYGQASPDIWYRFTVGSQTQVSISTCGSNFDTYLHVLDEYGSDIISADDNGPLCSGTNSSIQQYFSAGTYYVVVEGYSSYTGTIQLSVTSSEGGTMSAGATMSNPIEVGNLGAGPNGFTDSRSNADACLGNDIGQISNDIYYRFTLTAPSVVKLSHCGSGFDTYMHLLDANGLSLATSDDNGPLCTGTAASIKTELPAGTYYLVSEGFGQNTGTIITSMSVELRGAFFSNAIDVGTLESGSSYSDTKNNSPSVGFGNEYGNPSDDIFYKFTLNTLTTTLVNISHCGSDFDSYLYLLDADGNRLASNDDNGPLCSGNNASLSIALGAGIYYIVSEGWGDRSGNVITQISVGQQQGWGSSDQNYVRTFAPRSPIQAYTALISQSGNKDLVQVSTQYFDGLGRPVQTVQRQASPGGNDIVQPVIYDSRGRESRKYLPYMVVASDGVFKQGNPDANVKAFYNPASPGTSGIGTTGYPYSDILFERSLPGRVIEQGAPGESWQPQNASISGSGHTVKSALNGNSYNQVKIWTISGNTCSTSSFYSSGTLLVTTTSDENGNRTIEYKDNLGHVVLKQAEYDANAFTDTYYVYDDFGNLRYVIPPAVTVAGFSEGDALFDQYIYAYHYDDQNRLTEKKIPEKGWEYIVYNQLDLPVLTQDAVQRQTGKWTFSRYDGAGRVVMTGEYSNNGSRATVQAAVSSHPNGVYEVFTGAGTEGYALTTFPLQDYTVFTVSYYGTYGIPGISAAYNASASVNTNAKGLLTGTKTAILGTTTLLLTVNYYDDYGRLKESIRQNHIGGTDRVVNTYSFSGELTASTRSHTSSTASATIANRYIYDHAGRRRQIFEKINNDPEVKLSESVYNEIGQLISKTLHNDQQSSSFSYNARGWLRTSASPQFSMQLKYDDGVYPQYNGNIANQLWGDASLNNTFTYTYDKMNRLLSGVSTGIAMSEVITYDLMGNVATLSRDGAAAASYNYTGNKLNQITGGLVTGVYTYDSNGNATTDGRNNASIGYNTLNLPATVTKAGLTLTYTYDATGKKLRKISNGTVREYVDGVEYNGNTIEFIGTEEGVARNNGGSFSYEYNLTDNVGNIRRTIYRNPVSGAIETVQKDDYYPFGMRKLVSAGQNKYLYNGKELQEELGEYDYGARFYDPVIARWNVIDGMAEKYFSFSPYHYAANNPIKNFDIDGNDFTPDAWAWVMRMIDNINRREEENEEKIDKKQKQLQEDGISERKAKRLNRQIENLRNEITDLEVARGEAAVLALSSQVYNVVESNTFSSSETEKAAALYNSSNGVVDIVLPGSSGLNIFSHELHHAFQFERGTISLTAHDGKLSVSPAKDWLAYDQFDEKEAYKRQGLFGSTYSSLPAEYNNRPKGPVSLLDIPTIVNLNNLPGDKRHAELQKLASRVNMAFRLNGTTYGPK